MKQNLEYLLKQLRRDCWKKYVGTKGLTFGIDAFGKSAPYKEIYKYFGLTVQNISQKTKKLIKSQI